MQRKTMVSVSCAAVLCAAGMAHAQTHWGLLDVSGQVAVPVGGPNGGSENLAWGGPIAPPVSPGTIANWADGNGAGQSRTFLLSEDGGLTGVLFQASVQYSIASSVGGGGPNHLVASRTLEASILTYQNGATGNIPDIPFLQQFLPNTPFSGDAKASFNFEAQTLCAICTLGVECDRFEIDTGDGFEEFCGELTGACIARWLAGGSEAIASFSWDPSGNGGNGTLTVDAPVFSSLTATITPAPSSALLAVLGFGIAARRRR